MNRYLAHHADDRATDARKPSAVATRKATAEELARLRALEPYKPMPYLGRDRKGRAVAGWEV